MATQVLTNAFVKLGSDEISDHVQAVRFNYEAEQQDDSAMGDTTRSMKGGLKVWDFEFDVLQDWAANNVDSIAFAAVGTTLTVAVRPDTGSITTSNPEYTGTGLVTGYNPLGNAVGEIAITTIKVVNAGTLSRNTS